MDEVKCPQCGNVMRQEGEMMKCDGCGHTMPKDNASQAEEKTQ